MDQTTDPTPPPDTVDETSAAGLPRPEPAEVELGSVVSGKRTSKRSSRRTRVVVRKVGPWSVFKLSLIFYFVVMLIGWTALLIVYGILGATGTIESITEISTKLGLWKESNVQPVIHGKPLFTGLFIAGLIAVAIWSLINFFVALAYNLVSDVVGGLELTLAESKHANDV